MINNNDDDMIFGRNNILEALNSGRIIDKILITEYKGGNVGKIIAAAKQSKIPISVLSRAVMDTKFQGQNHQGAVAYISKKEYCSLQDILDKASVLHEKPFVIIADEITDPHNIGAIIRTAECMGAHGVVISKHRAAGMSASVEKASGGAIHHMLISKQTNLSMAAEELKKAGLWLFACDMDADTLYNQQDYDCPLALVVGNEGKGISRLLRQHCDFIVSIPMKGKINCLNASVAAAIVMQEIAKSR